MDFLELTLTAHGASYSQVAWQKSPYFMIYPYIYIYIYI